MPGPGSTIQPTLLRKKKYLSDDTYRIYRSPVIEEEKQAAKKKDTPIFTTSTRPHFV